MDGHNNQRQIFMFLYMVISFAGSIKKLIGLSCTCVLKEGKKDAKFEILFFFFNTTVCRMHSHDVMYLFV